MQFTDHTVALEKKLGDWKEEYEGTLKDLGGPVWEHVGEKGYHQNAKWIFCLHAETWLQALERLGDLQLRKHVIYLILSCAKDIAHPYIDQAWDLLDATFGDRHPEIDGSETDEKDIPKPDLKKRLHAELVITVRSDVADGKPGAAEYANMCKQVGVSLSDKPTA